MPQDAVLLAPELTRSLEEVDPEVEALVAAELRRQSERIGLIASENLMSRAVLAAQAGGLAGKYAEGLPGARYCGGCTYVDELEELARQRLRELFGAEYANVQPHSGTQANMAAYHALCAPGDTVLAMDLAHGGHVTHGSAANFSGRLYRFVHYTLDRDRERLDMDAVAALARRVRPRLIVAGTCAYPRLLDFPAFAAVAREVGAILLVDMAHIAGLVAAGLHPSPVPYADVVTTTTHKTLRGPRGGAILCRASLARAIDRAVYPGVQGGPHVAALAAKAVALREAAEPAFAAYQRQVVNNAAALAAALARHGFRLVSGGTDTHLLLLDLRVHGISGRQAERALEEVGVVVNRNLIPFDPHPPMRASGIRLGTPHVTSRGMAEPEMVEIADVIAEVLRAAARGRAAGAHLAARVRGLAGRFPVPVTGG